VRKRHGRLDSIKDTVVTIGRQETTTKQQNDELLLKLHRKFFYGLLLQKIYVRCMKIIKD
jgi:hypothetical protein